MEKWHNDSLQIPKDMSPFPLTTKNDKEFISTNHKKKIRNLEREINLF